MEKVMLKLGLRVIYGQTARVTLFEVEGVVCDTFFIIL
jgi:hypothetical protein